MSYDVGRERAIGDAVRQAHPCEDNHCDIHAMLEQSHWALAARTLFSATDVERGDVLADIDCSQDEPCRQCLSCAWDAWAESMTTDEIEEAIEFERSEFGEWHDAHKAECPHCEAILYIDVDGPAHVGDTVWCSNCAKTSTVRYGLVAKDAP